MGWEDRDWARWTTDERRRYLGNDGTTPKRARGGSTSSVAIAAGFSLLLVVVGSVSGIGPVSLPYVGGQHHANPGVQTPHPPAEIAGKRLVCTQRTYDPTSHTWRCTGLAYADAEPSGAAE